MTQEPTTPTTPAAAPAIAGRVLSIDALRDFDMFWLIGGKYLFLYRKKILWRV